MIKYLRKAAALGYVTWKQTQLHFRKKNITIPRILIEDCWDTQNNSPQFAETPTKMKAIAKNLKEIHHHQSKIIKKAAFYRDIFILVYVHENLVKHSIILH